MEINDQSLVQATYQTDTATVVGFLQPHAMRRRITLMSITGPSGSTLRIRRGYDRQGTSAPINSVFPGTDRTYDNTREGAPMWISPGEALTFTWSGGVTAAGQVGQATVTSAVDRM